ncbi:MAG TPA: substrate-binding domain-containing protein [Salinisphaeraceae bacterium]|nr:substrate-binding domain-containing protein [Salinisphaeraceae bacterium]
MKRRSLLQAAAALGLLGPLRGLAAADTQPAPAVDTLPPLAGDLTLYLGRGEGGLYGDIIDAIRKRCPDLNLSVRRAPAAALVNTLEAEHRHGLERADLFWSIDATSLGAVAAAGLAKPVPNDILQLIKPAFRYQAWAAISGRLRTIPYNPDRVEPAQLPTDIMAFANSDYRIGWAPSYGAFRSFITAMRLLEGEQRTRAWLLGVKPHARSYGGELGVVMAVERGEVDLGFANHYYTLRLKQGMPDANVQLALTEHDAGSLINASGAVLLSDKPLAAQFLRYLFTREVQSYLMREAFEIPMVANVEPPAGLPTPIQPPEIDLTQLTDLQGTLRLLRETGVL